MKSKFPLLLASLVCVSVFFLQAEEEEAQLIKPRPLKALLVAGGCCHDYATQHKLLYEGIQARANVQVDVYWTRDKTTNPLFPIFDDPNWANGYDVIIHNECASNAAKGKEPVVLDNILKAHKTVPAVHLHCAMHSFRRHKEKTTLWYKHIGLRSNRHGPQAPISIEFTDNSHPITATLDNWVTDKEELYDNSIMFGAKSLAIGTQKYQKNNESKEDVAVVAWTNVNEEGVKSFSTTLGHNNQTVGDSRYLELVTRGLLWTVDSLKKDYLTPYKGSNIVSEVIYPKVLDPSKK